MTDNKLHIVQEMYAAFGRGDGDAIFARLTDDVDWSTETESTVAPWYGQRVGLGERRRLLRGAGEDV